MGKKKKKTEFEELKIKELKSEAKNIKMIFKNPFIKGTYINCKILWKRKIIKLLHRSAILNLRVRPL